MKPIFVFATVATIICFFNSCKESNRTVKEELSNSSPVTQQVRDTIQNEPPVPTCFFIVPQIANNIFSEDEEMVIRGFLQDNNSVFKKGLVENEFVEEVMDTSYQLKLAGNNYTFLRTQERDILYSAVISSNTIKLCQNLKIGMTVEQLEISAKIEISKDCKTIKIVGDEETTEVFIYLENGVVKKITYDLLL